MQAILQSRGINRVVHFHCDHFEPFRADVSGQRIGLKHVQRWNEVRLQYPLGQATSLFLHTKGICYIPSPDISRIPLLQSAGDIFFAESSVLPEEKEIYAFLREQPDLDFQVHMHHEFWTASSCADFPVDPARDAIRLRDVLKLNLAYYREHLLRPFKQWGFVHGCWALNGSDKDICNITSEMLVLRELGCVADFSFPAGRPWCDPVSLKHPYTMHPYDTVKCYDTAGAAPAPISTGSGAWTPDRMLIWSCPTPTGILSLDGLGKQTDVTACGQEAANLWLSTCPVIDGTLFIKTHGHSLRWDLWQTPETFESLFGSPTAARAFELVQGACEQSQVPVEHWPVTGVIEHLQELDGGAE